MTRTNRLLVCALAGALALGATGSAHAATSVGVSGTTLYVSAQAGKTNDLGVAESPGRLSVSDRGDITAAGAGCLPVNANTVTCGSAGITALSVTAGDRDDAVMKSASTTASIDGGSGNDRLDAAPSAGWNQLWGGPGTDILRGGSNTDVLDGGPGGDLLNGGGGSDSADYGTRVAPVRVTLDLVADDGEPGEGDYVQPDVENVRGGAANDILKGSAAGNRLYGGAGDDFLNGLDGNDLLHAGPGSDTLLGGFGNDSLEALDGVPGNDRLNGEADADACTSDAGDLRLSC